MKKLISAAFAMLFLLCPFTAIAASDATLAITDISGPVSSYDGATAIFSQLNTFATADITLSTTAAFSKVAIRATIPQNVEVEADIYGNGQWVPIRDGEYFGSTNGFDVPANIVNSTQIRIKLTKGGSYNSKMELIHVNDPDNPIYTLETQLIAPQSEYSIEITDNITSHIGEALSIPFQIQSGAAKTAGYENAALKVELLPAADFKVYSDDSLLYGEDNAFPLSLTATYAQSFNFKTTLSSPGNYILGLTLVNQDSGVQLAKSVTKIEVSMQEEDREIK